MHVAAEAAAIKSLKLLAKAGGDVDAKDNAGHTPLAIAVSKDFSTTVKTLIEAGETSIAKEWETTARVQEEHCPRYRSRCAWDTWMF